ncbi:MAG: TolC family outer membrane protein [Burkholderiaceae bacterium]
MLHTLRSRPFPLLLAFGMGCLMHGGTSAQSLPELYEAARGYDAAYQSVKAQSEAARFRAAQADARFLPNVGLSAGASQTESSSPFPPSGANDRRGLSTVQAGLRATQPLYNPGNSVIVEQARRAFDLSLSDLEIAEQDLIVRVAQAYFDVLAAQDSLATAQTNKRAIVEQLASAKRNFEVGTATITDTREAQARFDLASAQELFAENDLLSKRVALDVIVGRSNVQPLALAAPVVLPGVAPADVNAWVSAADEQHPAVRKARLALEIAKLDTTKARADDGPTVDLAGSFGASRNTGSGVNPAGGNSLQAKLEVLLAMPLYSGGALQNRVRETLALEEKSRNDFDATRRTVAQTTRVAFFGLQSLHAQVKALEAAESSSQLALEATQLGYKVGVRVNLDVLNAQTQLFTTKRDLSKARYDVVLNGLKLRQASGRLQPDDVSAVDRLFRK